MYMFQGNLEIDLCWIGFPKSPRLFNQYLNIILLIAACLTYAPVQLTLFFTRQIRMYITDVHPWLQF